MDRPLGLDFDSAGNLYVSDSFNNRISVFGPGGAFLYAFGVDVAEPDGGTAFEICTAATGCRQGNGSAASGQLSSPTGIEIDGADRLYVADTNNGRVDVFSVTGGSPTFLHAFGRDVNEPDGGTGWEVCTTACRAGDGFMAGAGFWTLRDVTLDAAGRLYASEDISQRISVFDSPGTTAVSFRHAFGAGVDTGGSGFEVCTLMSGCQGGVEGASAGQFDGPHGLAVDGSGRLHIGETGNHRVSVINAAGTSPSFRHAFGWDVGSAIPSNELETCDGLPLFGFCQAGVAGGGDGQLDALQGVALDLAGNLLAADDNNNRVTGFSAPATSPVQFLHAYGFDVDEPDGGTTFEVCFLDPGPGQGCRQGDSGLFPGGFGQLDFPRSIEVDCRGAVWVGDAQNGRVTRYGEPGTPLPPCPVASGPSAGTPLLTSPPSGTTVRKKCRKKRRKKGGQRAAAAKKKKKKCGRKKRRK